LLLDVREPWEYEICHIAGSVAIPMKEVAARMEELQDAEEIVVICHHGMRSAQVAAFLARSGMDNVANLSGGIDAWARTVDGTMAVY
jgi:rhodanese-related sulfurtransferase